MIQLSERGDPLFKSKSAQSLTDFRTALLSGLKKALYFPGIATSSSIVFRSAFTELWLVASCESLDLTDRRPSAHSQDRVNVLHVALCAGILVSATFGKSERAAMAILDLVMRCIVMNESAMHMHDHALCEQKKNW